MKKLTSIILSTLGTALLFTHAHSASFDCKKAATWVEKTICESSELSNLDDAMANKYKQALANNSVYKDSSILRDNVITDQRLWLKFQRNTCKEINCLVREYQEQVDGKVQFGTTITNSSMLSAVNAPSINAFGDFSETVTISMYDPETKKMDQGEEVSNILIIHSVSGKPHLAIIDAVFLFTNAHTCSIEERKAIWSENHWTILGNIQDKNTELRLYPITYQGKTQLLLRDPDNRFRSQNCGMRGYFDSIVLERE